MSAPNQTLKQRAYRGIKDYLAISLYLWIILGLFVLYKSVLLSEEDIPFTAHGFALLNALALGKIMLLAQEFHFADQAKEAPLIYPTLLKSAAFAIILGVFKIIEEALIGLFHRQPFSESIAALGGGSLKGILTFMLLLCVLLIPFFGFTELDRVFGEEKLKQLFFRARRPAAGSV
jgi:hypothetical protein